MSRGDDLYSRQKSLTILNYDCAVVIGCGGIGNWVALDLALSGCIKTMYLIDPDTIEESNLNRTLFEYTDIGSYKVDAVARQIICRRPQQDLVLLHEYMTDSLAETFIQKIFGGDNSFYHSKIIFVDCRDDLYEDCYRLNCKLYKVGYDGMSITVDGNPRLTKVFGQRGGSYRVTPSYIGSAQLAAILVCNDICYPKICKAYDSEGQTHAIEIDSLRYKTESPDFPYLYSRPCHEYDELGRINECVTIDCTKIIGANVEEQHDYIQPDIEHDYKNLPLISEQSKEENNVSE